MAANKDMSVITPKDGNTVISLYTQFNPKLKLRLYPYQTSTESISIDMAFNTIKNN